MNKISTVLYLGPTGSYSDIVKEKFSAYFSQECKYEPLDSIYNVLRRLYELNNPEVAAVVPIENSIEGVVRDTQDNLVKLAQKEIRVIAETNLEIQHALIGQGDISKIKEIISHPQALAQCREYIFNTFENKVTLRPVLSTSKAVELLKEKNEEYAAIANTYCANIYGLNLIQTNINDEKNNMTRFLLLGKIKPKRLSENKICITFSTENKPGALNKILSIFEKYELNLSYIDSRPSRKELGEYVFYIDFYGYIEDELVSKALIEIKPFVKTFELLSLGANCI